MLSDGEQLPYDLFLGVPVHRVPAVVAESGMCVDGWVPVDPLTLETRFPGVYAVGDVTSVGTPKAGVFAEGQAAVVADADPRVAGAGDADARTTAAGICYLEAGGGEVGKVDVTFRSGERPVGDLVGPSVELAADKSHVRRRAGRALVRPRLDAGRLTRRRARLPRRGRRADVVD